MALSRESSHSCGLSGTWLWTSQDSDDDAPLHDSDGEPLQSVRKTTAEEVKDYPYLTDQISEATTSFTAEEVHTMIRNAQEKGAEWWLKEYVIKNQIPPRKLLLAFGVIFSRSMEPSDEMSLKVLKMTLRRIVRRRERLTRYNTIEDVVKLLQKSKHIMVLSGAGISVASGIPDFRSKDGIYQILKSTDLFDLDDPQQMFDLEFFKEDPHVFYSFAKHIYPSTHQPSLSHHFIKLLETKQKLLRNYTQNIDDLESSAGIVNVIQCHGSFSKATCLQCGTQFNGKVLEASILSQSVPICELCPPPKPRKARKRAKKATNRWTGGDTSESDADDDTPRAVLKPNITFYGEKLSGLYDQLLRWDRDVVDLLIVMGTSLKVTPVSEILCNIPHSVPQILINKTPIKHMNADVVLLGNAETIVDYLCNEALGPGWELSPSSPASGKRKASQSADKPQQTWHKRVGNSHVWLFEGAEGGKFVEDLEGQAQAVSEPKVAKKAFQPSLAKKIRFS